MQGFACLFLNPVGGGAEHQHQRSEVLPLSAGTAAGMAGAIWAYLNAACQASASVVILSIAGAWATRTKRMNSDARKSFATLSKDLLLPAMLIAKVPVSGLTVHTLGLYWVLPVACTFYVVLGFGLASLLVKLVGVPKQDIGLVCSAAALPTTTGPIVALFLAVMAARGEMAASGMGVSSILIYTAFMNMFRWTVGWRLMAPPTGDREKADSTESSAAPPADGGAGPDAEHAALLSGETAGEAGYGAAGHAAAGAAGAGSGDGDGEQDKGWFAEMSFERLLEPPVLAAILAIAMALAEPLHPLFFAHDAPLRPAVTNTLEAIAGAYVPLSLFILGSQLAYGPERLGGGHAAAGSEHESALSRKSLAVVVVNLKPHTQRPTP